MGSSLPHLAKNDHNESLSSQVHVQLQSRGVKLHFIAGNISSMVALKRLVVAGAHYIQSKEFRVALCTKCSSRGALCTERSVQGYTMNRVQVLGVRYVQSAGFRIVLRTEFGVLYVQSAGFRGVLCIVCNPISPAMFCLQNWV